MMNGTESGMTTRDNERELRNATASEAVTGDKRESP